MINGGSPVLDQKGDTIIGLDSSDLHNILTADK